MATKAEVWGWIHETIHNRTNTGVKVGGIFYPVETRHKGLRSLRFQGVLFIEQNTEKDSKWALMARAGSKITWVIREGKPWGRIVDGVIEEE